MAVVRAIAQHKVDWTSDRGANMAFLAGFQSWGAQIPEIGLWLGASQPLGPLAFEGAKIRDEALT